MSSKRKRRDGSYYPFAARQRLKRIQTLIAELDSEDFSRQDSDNMDVVVKLLTTIYIRHQRRAEAREEQV